MAKVHFFKGKTRLGIRFTPYGQKEEALGVEDAPDAVLSNVFLKNFKDYSLSSYVFPKPEEIKEKDYLKTALHEGLRFSKFIENNLKNDEIQVIVGGDHSITYSSILADIKKFGTNIGIIHFDSHPDFNLYCESPSKNFHGMYLRIFFDQFDLPDFNQTVPDKLPIGNVLFIGDLEQDTGEEEVFEKLKPLAVTHFNMLEHEQDTLELIKSFTRKFSHIHVSFDVDVFERKIVSATGTPSKKGFKIDQIFSILDVIKNNAPSLTIDIAEYNPWKNGAKESLKISKDVLIKLLK